MLIKLILGLSLIFGSNFIGTEKKKNVIIGIPQWNGTIQYENKIIYVKERNTGETITATSMILVGTTLFIWYLIDKDKLEREKKNEKN